MTFTHDKNLDSLSTIRDWIRWGTSLFQRAHLYFGHGTDQAADDALAFILSVTALSYSDIENAYDCRLSYDEKKQLAEFFKQRIETRKPAPYLTQTAYWGGLSFYVDERVLIPRSPLAELIEQKGMPWIHSSQSVHRILDLCTGSGCIGILSAVFFEEAEVDLVDISKEALAVAEKNIASYDLTDRVHRIESDLFSGIPEKTQYDIIFSNPPYVSETEYQTLPPEYHHEPKLGLVAKDAGLNIVIRILQNALPYLSQHGVLIVEVGNSETALTERFPSVPFTWLHFERGGEGVFLLTYEQLKHYQDIFHER